VFGWCVSIGGLLEGANIQTPVADLESSPLSQYGELQSVRTACGKAGNSIHQHVSCDGEPLNCGR